MERIKLLPKLNIHLHNLIYRCIVVSDTLDDPTQAKLPINSVGNKIMTVIDLVLTLNYFLTGCL